MVYSNGWLVEQRKSDWRNTTMHLPVQLTRENGSWMARCPDVQGLLVVGDTIDKVLDELPAVAEALYEACQEQPDALP
jgi:predicted RNase H-like HicB family nuclease